MRERSFTRIKGSDSDAFQGHEKLEEWSVLGRAETKGVEASNDVESATEEAEAPHREEGGARKTRAGRR